VEDESQALELTRYIHLNPVRALIVVSQAFGVEPTELCVSRRHGNEARSAGIYVARQVTDAAVGVIGEYFGGVSMAAISQMVARVEHRRGEDRAWNRRLVGLLKRLRTSG
jgi:chromosomal replication initiation ATPase DnaA